MNDLKNTQSRVTREALSGRLPILAGERVYTKYRSFLWTATAFSAATWSFLIGGYLPYIGNTVAGIVGLCVGQVLGLMPVVLAGGVISYRYGLEPIDAVKTAFGRWGMVVPLVGAIATLLGWTYIVVALTSEGAGNVVKTASGSTHVNHTLVAIIAIAAMVLVWAIATRGPWLFERISSYIGPGHVMVTIAMLAVLIHKFGGGLWSLEVPANQVIATSHAQGFAYAVEFGVAGALTWWPAIGGLTRLVANKNHIIGPSAIGIGLIGAGLLGAVAALAGAAYGTPDPTVWMISLGGKVFGSLIITWVLLANIATMVIMIYLAGVTLQHIRALAKMRWDVLIAILLLPGIFVAFHTEWVLSQVLKWLTYNGVMFIGVTAIMAVDYFILRRQKVDLQAVFAKSSRGKYWFWGGVNWVAVAVVGLSIAFYLWLYDPISLKVQPVFSLFGASLPTMALSALLYYVLSRAITIPLGKGGYKDEPIPVTEEAPNDDDLLVKL